MPSLYVIIDLPTLQSNLSAAAGCELTEQTVRDWLANHGFEPAGLGWLADEPALQLLHATEVDTIWELKSFVRSWPWETGQYQSPRTSARLAAPKNDYVARCNEFSEGGGGA